MDRNNNKFVCPYANLQSCSLIPDDEINLLDLWNILWGRRWLILVIVALITAAASAYAFFSPKIYEAKINIAPSSDLGIGMLLAEITSIIPTSAIPTPATPAPARVFDSVLRNLQDRTIQAQFWAESKIVKRLNSGNEPHLVNMSQTWFMENLSVKLSSKKKGNRQDSVSLSGESPAVMAKILDDFISYVEGYSSREFIDNLKLKLAVEKQSIEKNIELKRNMAKQKAKMLLAGVIEQKKIAEKLHFVEMPQNLAGKPRYARGTKALQVEIDSLRQREKDGVFFKELPHLQETLAEIDKIDFSNANITALRATAAIVSQHPKKPKRQLIILLGLALGLMTGVFAAFLTDFVKNAGDRKNQNTGA